MITLRDILGGVLVPILVFVSIFHTCRFSQYKEVRNSWPGGLAMAAGFALGYAVMFGPPPDGTPREAIHWLFYLIPASFFLILLESYKMTNRWWIFWPLRAVYLIIVFQLLLEPTIQYVWTETSQAVLGVSIVSILALLSWINLDTRFRAESPLHILPAMIVLALATSIALGFGGSQRFAQTEGIFVSMLCAAFLFCWRQPQSGPDIAGMTGVFVFAQSGLLAVGYFFAELDPVSLGLLIAAPLLLSATAFGPLRKIQGIQRGLVLGVLIIIPAMLAIWFSVPESLDGYY